MASQSLQPILALLGYPVGGNPIQYMMEKAFAHCGLDWRYVSLEVRPEHLADAVRGLKVMGFSGGNCAAPHQETIGPLLDQLGRTAELTGVVNLLIRRDDDELIGENTEGRALIDLLGGSDKLGGRHAVVLGVGQMAKAIAVELAAAGAAQIAIVDHVEARASELVELLTGKLNAAATAVCWEGDYSIPPEIDLVIHTAEAVQGDANAPIALALESLVPTMTVVDTTIDPPRTWLLDEARERGCATVDGVAIFTNQVSLNFETWTGARPDRALLCEAVEEFLEL